MPLPRTLALAGLTLLLGGCYGATLERVEDQLTASRRELQVLRESFQAQQRSVQVLQDRVALLEDRAESRALHGGLGQGRPLPVVKLSPEPAPDPAEDEASEPVRTITQADVEPARRRAGPLRPVPPPSNAAFAGNIGVVPLEPDAAQQGPLPPGPDGPDPGAGSLADTAPMDQALLAYRRAQGLYDRGNLQAALVALEDFVRAHPRHDFADNALFLLGRARFEQARYPAALKTFRAVVEDHPTGNKVPDALLMIGRTQLKLGQAAEGRETLARLMALFPDGAAAREASQVLAVSGRM